ncbi:hypothetical protein DOTSEDRAFT_34540 [Dothistroma septosporum NZE10]|uniref:Uncharacterized protein n=1 Tax=Dothistroma septosporum (strain NZE10 / CBS 128990) TaxID=675120 RepID=N1PNN5_DOTSN|nr:hypothetical protein DOTSEDRAFT_34540 [Dothistroma septosporum NZE10]
MAISDPSNKFPAIATMSKHFPFSRLPRELRDRIYADLGGRDVHFKIRCNIRDTCDRTVGGAEKFYTAAILSAPRRDVMIVCKRFKLEYETEVIRTATLRVQVVQPQDDALNCYVLQTDSRLLKLMRIIPCLQVLLSSHRAATVSSTYLYQQPMLTTDGDWRRRIACCFERSHRDHVVYKASLTDDGASWLGLDLEILGGKEPYWFEDDADRLGTNLAMEEDGGRLDE